MPTKVYILLAVLILIGLILWANHRDTPPLSGVKCDRIVIEKARRTLTLYRSGTPVKSYRIALGRNPIGPKRVEGDNRTPEGLYSVLKHNPRSAFHLALRLSYPEAKDIEAATRLGSRPGSDIMIHGMRNGLQGLIGRMHRNVDWTAGCIAVTNWEIEEIYDAVPDGVTVEILP